jgi:hypothetical protein
MTKELRSVALVVAAAGFVVGACACIAYLTWHLHSLEARLGIVEAALKTKANPVPVAGAMPEALSKQGAAPPVWISRITPPGSSKDDLNRRVEKIEKALTPHLELLPPVRPGGAPSLNQ